MDEQKYTILLIDDDDDDYVLVRQHLLELPRRHYQLEWASSFEAGRTAIEKQVFDAILMDYRMGPHTGIELVREAVAHNYPAPIILLTGQGSDEVDLEAMKAGAADYLNKNEINGSLLDRSIRYAVERKQHEAALLKSEQALRESEGRFRVALSNVAIAVFSTDLELRYTWFYSTAMGNLPEQFIGKRDDEIMPEENVKALLDIKRRVLAERVTIRDEIEVKLSTRPMILAVSVEPYFNSAGEMIGVIGASYDVTGQRLLERERVEHLAEMKVQHRLTELREQERQAIAREIHDGPVQTLSSLIFRLQYSKENIQDPPVKAEIKEVQAGLQETVHGLRDLINELRPPSLIRFGLAKAIVFHLEGFREKHLEIDVEEDIQPVDDEIQLNDQVKLNLFRIYHEAVNNTVQHARATKVQVHLSLTGRRLILKVADNGVGLREPVDLADHLQHHHYGLAGMKERAQLIGGDLEVTSQPGGGTTVQVSIPIETP